MQPVEKDEDMPQKSTTNWKNYEEVARYLLSQFCGEFGLERVEGKQQIGGRRSSAVWEIDAKGFGRTERRLRTHRVSGVPDKIDQLEEARGVAEKTPYKLALLNLGFSSS